MRFIDQWCAGSRTKRDTVRDALFFEKLSFLGESLHDRIICIPIKYPLKVRYFRRVFPLCIQRIRDCHAVGFRDLLEIIVTKLRRLVPDPRPVRVRDEITVIDAVVVFIPGFSSVKIKGRRVKQSDELFGCDSFFHCVFSPMKHYIDPVFCDDEPRFPIVSSIFFIM